VTTWYSIDIADSDEAKRKMQRIMDAFMPKYIGSGRPLGMAIFHSYSQESSTVTVYFSPKSASLAIQFGASPCGSTFYNKDLSLLVGDERSIDYLFPDADTEE